MNRYRQHYMDLNWLLKKFDSPTDVISQYLRRRLNMWHHELVGEIPSTEEIEEIEQNIIKCFAALYVFSETMENLHHASARNLGSVELTVRVGEICDSHVTENIRLYQKALEEAADKLARYGEQILFKEECVICK